MKRNITANLSGSLYNIDEDAYTLLIKYLDDMRAFFSRQPGGKEIADDIESRASELMSEMATSDSRIVTIEDVQAIIQRIGTPEEMDAEQEPASGTDSEEDAPVTPPPFPPQQSDNTATTAGDKKLYRDVNNKMLGGVLAGLGQYFGIDPLWLRILTVVLTFFYGMTIPVYIMLWILISPAVTPAQRLQMKGEPINMESLGDEIINNSSNPRVANNSSFVNGVLHLMCVLLKSLLILFGAGAIIFLIGLGVWMVVMMGWASINPASFMTNILGVGRDVTISLHTILPVVPTWGLFICGMVCIVLTIYLIIYAMMRMAGKTGPLPRWGLGTTVIAWFVALFISAACFGILAGNASDESSNFNRQVREIRQQRDRQATTDSRNQLEADGWTINKERNLTYYTSSGKDFRGIKGRHYLDAYNSSGDMDYEVVRKIKTAPGHYTLTAAGRTDGNGAEIFAINGSGQRSAAEIPAYGGEGGGIWLDASEYIKADTVKTSAKYSQMNRLAKANNGKGFGWTRVEVTGITVGPDSILTYGVTNCSPTSAWDGTWLSASDFELTPVN